eukprot:766185_1
MTRLYSGCRHLHKNRHRYFSAQATAVQMNNFEANKLINNIYTDIKLDRAEQHNEAISKIFDIYNQINEPRNHFIVNKLLRVCLDLNNPHKLLNIWSDIELLHKSPNKSKDIAYVLLLKSCIKSDQIPISKCIQALKWMTQAKYTLKTQNNLIIKLITKCDNLSSLQYVHSIFNKKWVESTRKDTRDISVETAFIKAFGHYNDTQTAHSIFHSLPHKDTICINVMLQIIVMIIIIHFNNHIIANVVRSP